MSHDSKTEKLKEFGRTLRKIRQEVGISQEELAHRCSLDRTYVGGIERGERNVSLINLLKLADALKIPLSQILKAMKE